MRKIVVLLVAAVVLCLWDWRKARAVFAQDPFAAIFCLLFLAGYYALYAWYDQIINDTRFVLSIFLPFVLAASLFVLRVGRDRVFPLGGRQIPFEQFFAGLLLGLTVIDVVYNATGLAR